MTTRQWLVSMGLVTALERVVVVRRRHRVVPDPVSIAIWRVEARTAGVL